MHARSRRAPKPSSGSPPRGAGASPSLAPRTLALPRTPCFRFGPAYTMSESLKLFKFSSQRLNRKT